MLKNQGNHDMTNEAIEALNRIIQQNAVQREVRGYGFVSSEDIEILKEALTQQKAGVSLHEGLDWDNLYNDLNADTHLKKVVVKTIVSEFIALQVPDVDIEALKEASLEYNHGLNNADLGLWFLGWNNCAEYQNNLLGNGWRDMDHPDLEKIKKDRTHIHLGYKHMANFDVIAFWDTGDWSLTGNGRHAIRLHGRPDPTNWKPLPKPPQGN